ncbi:MAG: NAD(P)-binding protein [Pseudomonadales bacterium]|nr:FAD-dependent oxidoreductase [Pseudomonadales bacterium]NIX06839.1 NAD(P)-binding protein [Pseudomonadales bacterium]
MSNATRCCIVGAGPAGMFLALLLARRGVPVTLLELHRDLDRDFRGDTVHASTLEVLDQIGLADRLLALPHAKMRQVTLHTAAAKLRLVDFSRLKTRFPYVMVMPQVAFLNYLHDQAARYPEFRCVLGAGVQQLLETDGRVTGVRFRHDGEEHELRAELVIAADGRFSRLRKLAGLEADGLSPPMDVCWFRLPRDASDGHEAGGFFVGEGRMLIALPRSDEWQIGYVFPKGDFKALRESGIQAFRDSIAATAPWLAGRTEVLDDWSGVHLLTVTSDRLPTWHRPGLLCIGDAAHVMSPVGGVGINAAIGDAVEAANVLTQPLLDGVSPGVAALAEVQRRREGPTRLIQDLQARIQDTIVSRALRNEEFQLPLPVRLILATPGLRNLPPKIFALGIKPLRLEAP